MTDAKARVATSDLKRLDAVKAKLGDKAISYVVLGAGETVLSTIAVACSGNELDICRGYVDPRSPTLKRRRLFARMTPYDHDFVRRYAEVLAAASPAVLETAAGTEAVPKAIRVFFAEAFLGVPEHSNIWPPRPVSLDGKGLTLDTALQMTKRLGGETTDLFDVLYGDSSKWSCISGHLYRQVVDVRAFVQANPEAVAVAGGRMPATARADLIGELSDWGLAHSPAFLDFVLDQAGAGSKRVRDAASSALAAAAPEVLERPAARRLKEGNVNARAGMVEVLARLGTSSARATLEDHRQAEKTARIIAAIDNALAVSDRQCSSECDDDEGYVTIDGHRVDIPPLRPLPSAQAPRFGDADRAALSASIAGENDRIRKQNEETKRAGYKYSRPRLEEKLAEQAVALFNGRLPRAGVSPQLRQFLSWGAGMSWASDAFAKLPDLEALEVAALVCGATRDALSPYARGPAADRVRAFLEGPHGDLRHLEAIDVKSGVPIRHGDWRNTKTRPAERGDFLRLAIRDGFTFQQSSIDHLPREAVWPYVAGNLDTLDEALGLKPQGAVKLDRVCAIRTLLHLPGTPARYFGALLDAATGLTKAGRAEARALLQNASEIEPRLVALLEDSRLAVRAGAAQWLAERDDPSACKALRARFKKEKSEVVRAAILTALDRLGDDLSVYVGPDALVAEARKGLESAKLEKLAWLGPNNVPRARFRDGATVPPEVLRWWLALAFKLKQPGGNALLEIYLDQLEPRDAEAFSRWVLDSWLNFDTARPSEADANAHAKAHARQHYQTRKRWMKDYTEEQAFAELKRDYLSQYPNSGAASKGILGLATRTAPVIAADRVRAYLKSHGSRTSQAGALLEMLAASEDPTTLQVVIAAATRLKQKSVQKLAGELVQRVAQMREWTLDELADRTIPSAGLDDDGVLTLTCGEDNKNYEARVDDGLKLALRNPAGKAVSSLPSGQDDATKASKKRLSASRKELKQIVAMQSARLYEALCAERTWPWDDWRRDFLEHPVMRHLLVRIVWIGLDADGALAGTFRPTAEGDFTDAADNPVDPSAFAAIRIAHGALLDNAAAAAWEQHLADYEVSPLFTQFGRSLLRVNEANGGGAAIEDRKGWVTDAFTVRGAAAKLGYERGEALDGGYFNEYRKSFSSAGLVAVIEFSGNCLPEENVPAALIALRFYGDAGSGRGARTVKLDEVPPVLLSECWNDYHAMAAKAAFDAKWEDRMPW